MPVHLAVADTERDISGWVETGDQRSYGLHHVLVAGVEKQHAPRESDRPEVIDGGETGSVVATRLGFDHRRPGPLGQRCGVVGVLRIEADDDLIDADSPKSFDYGDNAGGFVAARNQGHDGTAIDLDDQHFLTVESGFTIFPGSPLPVDTPTEATGLPSDIIAWIESETGSSVTASRRVPGGNNREAWFIDLESGARTQETFLRYDRRPSTDIAIFWPLQVEAKIFRALYGTGVTVPRILAVHPEAQAVLSERVQGETWFYRIAHPDEQVAVAQDFIRNLAALHLIDPKTLHIAELGPVLTPSEHALIEVATIRRRATNADGQIDPFLEVCLDWLRDNVPAYDGQSVLVQGDTGPGNFMYHDARVTAVVDWELAHFGDPMDDIAWLSLRTVQDTFTHLPDRLAEYENLTGFSIDEARVWYYRVMAEVRLAGQPNGIGTHRLADVARRGGDAANSLIYGILHRRLLIQAFANAAGFSLETHTYESAGDGPTADTLDAIAETLRTVVERAGDPLAVARAKGAARLVRHARALDADGARLAAEEYAELVELIGHDPGSLAAARAGLVGAVRRGAIDSSVYVARIWRQMERDDFLARDASGALRHRTWPPLR